MKQTGKFVKHTKHRHIGGWMEGCSALCLSGWMDEWIDGFMFLLDGYMDRWLVGWKYICMGG